MKRLGVILIFTLFSTNLISQSSCSCDELEQGFAKPDTLFQIGEKSIAICNGYYENGFVSEFSLIACGDTSISKFYDATLEYKIELANDTLYLLDFRVLWSFTSQNFEKFIWASEKYWTENSQVMHERTVVYEPQNNSAFENDFKTLWEAETKEHWSDNPKLIAWAFQLSLNHENIYKSYFKSFRDTFQISGANAEYYNELNRMYQEKFGN